MKTRSNLWMLRSAFAGLVAAASVCTSYSLIINPLTPDFTPFVASGDQTSQAQIDAAIASYIGTSTELYKQNVGGSESGALKDSYTTTFSNSPTDPSNALIDYVGGTALVSGGFLLVKDGNQTPAWYLFNLTTLGWDGTDDLVLSGFWPNQGAISHVSLYGPNSDVPGVPDGGSVIALMGIAFGALGVARRMMLV